MIAFAHDQTAQRLHRAAAAIAAAGHGMMTVAELQRLVALGIEGPQPQRTPDDIALDRMLVLRGLATRSDPPGVTTTVSARLMIFEALMEMEGRRSGPVAHAPGDAA